MQRTEALGEVSFPASPRSRPRVSHSAFAFDSLPTSQSAQQDTVGYGTRACNRRGCSYCARIASKAKKLKLTVLKRIVSTRSREGCLHRLRPPRGTISDLHSVMTSSSLALIARLVVARCPALRGRSELSPDGTSSPLRLFSHSHQTSPVICVMPTSAVREIPGIGQIMQGLYRVVGHDDRIPRSASRKCEKAKRGRAVWNAENMTGKPLLAAWDASNARIDDCGVRG
jgi:hypothetical protein